MHCFTLFSCWSVGVSGNYATFATYRVLTFNKHIYGSQEIAESGPRGRKDHVVIGWFRTDLGRDVRGVRMDRT